MISDYCAYLFIYQVPATPEIYSLSLHDALPISAEPRGVPLRDPPALRGDGLQRLDVDGFGLRLDPGHAGRRCAAEGLRSEEHTSELQSPVHLVCRLLLEKKKTTPENSIRSSLHA